MTADIVVVGAGIVGLCTAAAAHRSGDQVTVIDPDLGATSASTASGGLIRKYDLDGGHLAAHAASSFDPLRLLAKSFNTFHQTGSLTLQYTHDPLPVNIRADTAVFSAQALKDRWPQLEVSPNVIGIFEAAAGWIDAPSFLEALRQQLASSGVQFLAYPVDKISESHGYVTGVRTTHPELISAPRVVLAAGANSTGLARTVGVHYPLRTRRISYNYLSVGTDKTAKLPIVLDRTRSLWIRPCIDSDLLLVGQKSTQYSFGSAEPVRPTTNSRRVRATAAAIFPALGTAAIVGGVSAEDAAHTANAGSRTVEHCATPEGLTIAAGWDGGGFKAAPILGHLAASTTQVAC